MEEKHFVPEEFDKIADYLAGEATPEDGMRLEKWIAEKPEHKILFEKVKRVWQASEIPVEKFQPDVSRAWERVRPQHVRSKVVALNAEINKGSSSTSRHRWHYAVAASIVLAFLVGITFLFMGSGQHAITKMAMEAKKIKAKEKGELLLSDGSHVWLNSNSKLHYPQTFGENRIVYLEGEAYFEIAKDASKPFIIHSGSGIIEVLGTSFNVQYIKGEGVKVDVTEGEVALFSEKNKAESILLSKGDRGLYMEKGQKLQKAKSDDPNFLSWHTGILYFENTSLSSVARDLSKHYQTEVIAMSQSANECRLTSTFNNKSLEEVLEVIQLTMDVKIKKEKNKIIIEEKGCM